jgi:parvulin-like peptidyl-prolyl isomerase
MEINETPTPLAPPAQEMSTPPAPPQPPGARLTPSEPEKRSRKYPFLGGLIIGALILLIGATAMVYMRPPTDQIVRSLTNVLPFPAAVVNTEIITIKDFLVEYEAFDSYFKNQAVAASRPADAELYENIMKSLIDKRATQQLAEKYNLTLDQPTIDAGMQEAVTGAGGETAFKEQLSKSFGWTEDQFKARVVTPLVLSNQLSEFIAQDATLQAETKAKAQAALDRLTQGDEFASVAGDTSDDPSAKANGDIGTVKLSEMVDPWLSAIKDLKKGERTNIIEDSQHFIIFQLNSRKAIKDDTELGLSAIIVKKKILDQVVQEFLDGGHVVRFIVRTPAAEPAAE